MISSGLKASGFMLIIAGLLFGSFMVFHPANNPQGALEPIWVPVHVMWLLSYLLIICSFVPLYLPFTASNGLLATVSYYLAFIGTVLSVPIAVWDAFIVPYLAKHAPDFILQIEEISMETSVLVFRVIFFLSVFAFSLGFILYGISAVRSHFMPMLGGICLAAGAPTFWVGALFVSQGSLGNLVTEIGAVLLSQHASPKLPTLVGGFSCYTLLFRMYGMTDRYVCHKPTLGTFSPFPTSGLSVQSG